MKKLLSIIALFFALVAFTNAQNPPPRICPEFEYSNMDIWGYDGEPVDYEIALTGNTTGATFDISAAYNLSHLTTDSYARYNVSVSNNPDIDDTFWVQSGYPDGTARYNVTLKKSGCTNKYGTIYVHIEGSSK